MPHLDHVEAHLAIESPGDEAGAVSGEGDAADAPILVQLLEAATCIHVRGRKVGR